MEERLRTDLALHSHQSAGYGGGVSSSHALLFAQIAFARAVLSLSLSDAEDALERCWSADALANDEGAATEGGGIISALFGGSQEKTPADMGANLARQLVKANAHLMGAVMQVLLGRYIRAGLNLRVGWNLYHACAETVEREQEAVQGADKCIVDFGIGMFQLIASLLPSSYLAIAEYIGVSGNRTEAKRLLTRSFEADEVWSPFSSLLLLYFYTQLAPNLGILSRADTADVLAILASPCAQRHVNSALFLWMQGMTERLYIRDHALARATLARAEAAARSLPALGIMIANDRAWAHLEALDWLQVLLYYPQPLLYHKVYISPDRLYSTQPLLYHYRCCGNCSFRFYGL